MEARKAKRKPANGKTGRPNDCEGGEGEKERGKWKEREKGRKCARRRALRIPALRLCKKQEQQCRCIQ